MSVQSPPSAKVKSIGDLAETLSAFRRCQKKIVHCHGVFDLMHIGHIRHFEQARQFGDVLVVTITPDRFVNKGPHRPVFNEKLRAEAVAALSCVDYVAINEWPTAVETIHRLCPDLFVKGSEYVEAQQDQTQGIVLEGTAIHSVGGQLRFTEDITFSSSHLLNRYLPVFPKEVQDYLGSFCARYRPEQVLHYLQSARELKVLVIGEAIIDEYQYCETLGKSGKEPILAFRALGRERFAGGVLAIANHVAAFSDHIGVLTFLGATDTQEAFIREKVNAKVEKMFLYAPNCPTMIKRRFVEMYPFQKLFEIYVAAEIEDQIAASGTLCDKLKEVLPQYDVVIVADYGHGMLTPEAANLLCDGARFLAVNTQVNAGNQGFNTVSKYRCADYICVSENELRLDARSRLRNLGEIVAEAAEKLSCQRIVVTRGQQGCLCYGHDEGFREAPAFAGHVVDRIGAGDAVLSVTSLCAAQKAPLDVMGFVGSAVGAQAVAVVGNRTSIERVPLFRYIECLMK